MASHGRRHTVIPPPDKPKSRKKAFDLDDMFARIEQAIGPYKKAAMFELAEAGYKTPFEQLVACIISIRTFDEVSAPTARQLLDVAKTPAEIVKLGVERIDELIRATTFHGPKARTIYDIAARVVKEFKGQLPCDLETLLSLKGVGPKCAHLTLGVACGLPFISVDIHVHRVTNRWGYVAASTPDKTLRQLEEKLPKEHWIDINRLLVPFGKHICTGKLPRCSTCPVLAYCRQVGVDAHR
jgi:endonuclease-3